MRVDVLLRNDFPRPPHNLAYVRYDEARLTFRRLFNLWLLAWEMARGRTKLRSLPVKLVLEATNVCNLGCPACFTGAGENGRVRSAISVDSCRRIVDELATRNSRFVPTGKCGPAGSPS